MKKHVNTILVSFLFISFGLFFNSCEKKKRDNLEGEWLYVNMDLEEHTPLIWTFNTDNTLEANSAGGIITGTYDLDVKVAESFIDIEGIDILNVDGRYRLYNVDNEKLVICRIIQVDGKSDHRWKEFVRN
jgi:hypothetical protein